MARVIALGSVQFLLGAFFGALVDCVLAAWLVFMFAKKVIREAVVVKK